MSHSLHHFNDTHVFFFNDPATTEIYTLSLHAALPISTGAGARPKAARRLLMKSVPSSRRRLQMSETATMSRSEEHTSELQSRQYLVCRLLLEKKKKTQNRRRHDSRYFNMSPVLSFSN